MPLFLSCWFRSCYTVSRAYKYVSDDRATSVSRAIDQLLYPLQLCSHNFQKKKQEKKWRKEKEIKKEIKKIGKEEKINGRKNWLTGV